MRIKPFLFSVIGLVAVFPIAAYPSLSQSNAPILLAQTHKSVLNQWELALEEYTWNDDTFGFKITGFCPVERPRAKCGYPKPKVNVERGNQNGKPYQIISISGGSYEVGFNVQVIEITGINTDAKNQRGWLQNQVNFWRNKIENEGGGKLVTSREITVNGYKGMELSWQGERHQSGSSSSFIRIVVAGNRMYEISAGTLDGLVPALKGDIQTFLNGIKILKVTP